MGHPILEATDTGCLTAMRFAQAGWAARPLQSRLEVIAAARRELARDGLLLAEQVPRPPEQTMVSEVIPLLEACRFLEREAPTLLATRRHGWRGRPWWLNGVHLEVRREPLGVVLVVGPSNYPLLLAAVQTLQALAAGNAVIIKPGAGATPVLRRFVDCLETAHLPQGVLSITDESPEQAEAAIRDGVDKVFLTGSTNTGRKVLSTLVATTTPAVMELSGDDAAIILPHADLALATAAIRFGRRFNGGNTCIAPRRVIAVAPAARDVASKLPDVDVCEAPTVTAAIDIANSSPFGLGASIFGPERDALSVAARLRCGVVVINDMIVPTADPRMPFGGRGASGFGVTRGAEGLLEMTCVKAVAVRRSRWLPHLNPSRAADADLFAAFAGLLHAGGGLAERWQWARRLVAAVRQRGEVSRSSGRHEKGAVHG